ncbi:MAG: hypothetical protein ACI9UJ_001853 [bacterium]|jgi:hypothetical protein
MRWGLIAFAEKTVRSKENKSSSNWTLQGIELACFRFNSYAPKRALKALFFLRRRSKIRNFPT